MKVRPIAFVIATLVGCCAHAESLYISAEEAAKEIKSGATLLNALPPANFRRTKLPGAKNLYWRSNTFEEDLKNILLDKKKKVICYCYSGYNSTMLAQKLRDLKYDAYSVVGGFHRLKQALEQRGKSNNRQ